MIQRTRWRTRCAVGVLVFALPPLLALGQIRGVPQRAERPRFDPESSSDIFFRDAFEQLIGQRPDLARTAPTPGPRAAAPDVPEAPAATGEGLYAWSKIISATTMQNEVKALKLTIDQDVTTPGDFKGRGYQECRRWFSVVAMIFAIASEYDGEVRWKEDSPQIRDVFARTAANAKVGTQQVYNEAKLRKVELQDLLSGERFSSAQPSEQKPDWSRVCDRSPLMQRLAIAQQKRLSPLARNEADFKKNADEIVHEAEMIAAMAEVMIREGMEDADDEDYAAFCRQMRDAALEIARAARQRQYNGVGESLGTITKACDQCHNDYRG